MTQPSYHAIEWHSPPDLSTREVRSFPSRQERDAFVRGTPRGGTEFRLAVSGSEAQMTRRSVSRLVLPALPSASGAPVDASHPSAEL
jgi:hypothetical protein